jgi:hypothetical protein
VGRRSLAIQDAPERGEGQRHTWNLPAFAPCGWSNSKNRVNLPNAHTVVDVIADRCAFRERSDPAASFPTPKESRPARPRGVGASHSRHDHSPGLRGIRGRQADPVNLTDRPVRLTGSIFKLTGRNDGAGRAARRLHRAFGGAPQETCRRGPKTNRFWRENPSVSRSCAL